MNFKKNCSILVALAILFLPFTVLADEGEFRALWADAWGVGFLNPNEVDDLMQAARSNNFNAIVVQTRRRGDAFYMPRAPNNDPRTTAIDENFDALAALIDAAHNGSPRIEVHCWVTAFPVWSEENPPPQPGHIFNQHPEFLMENSSGQTFLSEGYYVDPGHPEAMRWIARMAKDIVSRYDVDGFHWDYIRYPRQDSGYNPTAIARFNEEFGLTGEPTPGDRRFSDWRRRQVGDFLRWVNAGLLGIRPDLVISAAIFGERSSAFDHFQDWSSWNAEGIIDLCLPMGYTSNNAVFMTRANDSLAHQGARRVYVGQGSFLNSQENTLMQLSYARSQGALGTVLYSYRVPRSGEMNADIRKQILAYVRDNFQPTWKETPPLPWKATTGIAKGRVIDGETGETVYNAHVSIDAGAGFAQRSCVQGGYAFFKVTGGSWTVTASADGRIARENVTVTPGGVAHVDLILRERITSDPPETILLTNFEDVNAGPDDGTVLFRQPSYATFPNLQLSPNSARMTRDAPAGIDGEQSLRVDFAFAPGLDNPWLRLSTHRAIRFPNPVLPLDRGFRFDLHSNQDAYVAIGIRDNGASGLVGSYGGDSGTIEWVGGITDNERKGVPGNAVPPLGRFVKAGEWTTLHFQLPDEPVKAFNGTGELTHSQGVFEHLAIVPIIAEDGTYSTNTYEMYFDNFAVTDEPPPGSANKESRGVWLLDSNDDEPERNFRIWTALDGRTLSAELLESDETSVTVRRDYDGRVFTISIDNLSEEDREFVAGRGWGSEMAAPRREVHAFYYPWYGNPEVDGRYANWNHPVIVQEGESPKSFSGGADIGANFYPTLGAYSSNDPETLSRQMEMLKQAKVDVISASWWGKGSFTDKALKPLFAAAEKHGIRINFHIEPFSGRNAETTREAIAYLIDTFGDSPALYRNASQDNRPMFYLYNSYDKPAGEWATLLQPGGSRTIRGTAYDSVVVGLWVGENEQDFMLDGGFDGFYTYFATDGFTYGSTGSNWNALGVWAQEHDLLFIPCVGPGYLDLRVRPWNNVNTRGRENGLYYDRLFRTAIASGPDVIGVTSFNEWHEGTQIEPAVPKEFPNFTYEDYRPRSPNYYLERTAVWVDRFQR